MIEKEWIEERAYELYNTVSNIAEYDTDKAIGELKFAVKDIATKAAAKDCEFEGYRNFQTKKIYDFVHGDSSAAGYIKDKVKKYITELQKNPEVHVDVIPELTVSYLNDYLMDVYQRSIDDIKQECDELLGEILLYYLMRINWTEITKPLVEKIIADG